MDRDLARVSAYRAAYALNSDEGGDNACPAIEPALDSTRTDTEPAYDPKPQQDTMQNGGTAPSHDLLVESTDSDAEQTKVFCASEMHEFSGAGGDTDPVQDGEADEDRSDDDDDVDDEDLSEDDVDFEFKWLEPIDVTITHASATNVTPKDVGSCEAKLIRRTQMRGNFHDELEQPSPETSTLAFDLFDRHGRLRTEFGSHPVKKGSGVWGQGLNHGDMLLIEEIFINKNYRRQGLGRSIVEALLTEVRQKTWSFFAFVRPDCMKKEDLQREWENLADDSERSRMQDREYDRAVKFYRSLGFRRIGSSAWLALAPNADHPSRQLAVTGDYDLPEAPPTVLHPLLSPFQTMIDLASPALEQVRSPQSLGDPEALAVLQNYLQAKESADPCWMSRDKHGNTILHLAASIFDVACVEWIMRQNFGVLLLRTRNTYGDTPLEMLQLELEELRTQRVHCMLTEAYSDKFEGHSDNAVRCLVLLEELGSVESMDRDALLRLSGGCTCGQCIKGFLSPRMSHALICQAQVGYDNMVFSMEDPGPLWVDCQEHVLGYLPLRVRNNLKTNKSMRQGFANLWQHIETCLENGQVPNRPLVLEALRDAGEWPPVTKNFFQRGGTIESAFLAICSGAMDQDEWAGDGQHWELCGADIEKLPECRDDHEFGFVSRMCGYRPISQTRSVDMMGNTLDEYGNIVDSEY